MAWRDIDHADAVYWARGDAEIAAGAKIGQYGMHLLGRADDGVDRTGLDAQGTAYAVFFIDQRYGARALVPVDGVEWNDGFAEQIGQTCDAFLAAWRALVMAGCVGSHGLGIGTTRWIAALGALRLRKQIFQFVGESRGNAQGKKTEY
jgi:hypothetical protein